MSDGEQGGMTDIRELPIEALESVATQVPTWEGAPALAWREVAPAAPLVWPPHLCLLGPGAEHWQATFGQRPLASRPLLHARLRGCRVAGRGLVIDPRRRVLYSQHLHAFTLPDHPLHEAHWWNWLNLDVGRPKDARATLPLEATRSLPLPPCLLIAQPGHQVFGHWLLEILPRIALAQRLGLGALPLLLPRPLPGFAAGCLGLLGIAPDQLALYDHRLELPAPAELHIVSRPFFGAHAAPLARALYQDIAERAGPPPAEAPRRLYLSRAGLAPDMRHANRADLRPLLQRHGFVEIRPETLPLAEQLRLLRGATHVVAEDGSAAHLAFAAPPGLVMLVLAAPNRALSLHDALAQVCGHRIGFVLGEPAAGAAASHVDYRIEPGLLEQALALLPDLT